MTAMQIAVDDVAVAAVDLAHVDMFAVHLSGDLRRPGAGHLSCHGGTYPDGAPSTFRIWSDQALPGADHTVTVRLVETIPADQVTPGKTLDELLPDEPRCERTDFTPTAAEQEALRSRPRVRTGFAWALRTSTGVDLAGRNGDDDSFAFSVLWTADRPDQARVHGSTNDVENVIRREGGTRLYNGMLGVGDSVTFRCGD